ncbi:TetR/AcrR family transcriptional regulator [Vibrio sp. S9_S30]|uniref:TetR/AcrR family transcriptional regulator n=1 Tax=Vibrio sp. S9_S30 TaxID=2720226 RepID=UPI001680644C|nr:TetR/AcrR family transcriptional regulator [Vibrio sp. S9_S30]MBD1557818.1 TetR/AcrR family transcriptional regulator [Vibrio sp. S9_S30]
MPYTKAHKQKSREKILKSAFHLFSQKGFDCVTIDRVMEDCGLTRGAFYTHFSSKAELYSCALSQGASETHLVQRKPDHLSPQEWVELLLNTYFSIEHVKGETPCPLAFFATDISTKNSEAKTTFSGIYQNMNQTILNYVRRYKECDENKVFAITALAIGTVAIARTMEDEQTILALLSSSRKEAHDMLVAI